MEFSILYNLHGFPPELLQRIIDFVPKRTLYYLKNGSYLAPFAFNALYKDIKIGSGDFLEASDIQDLEYDPDDYDTLTTENSTLQNDDEPTTFSSLTSFLCFIRLHPYYRPKSVIFTYSKRLMELSEILPEFLSTVGNIEVVIDIDHTLPFHPNETQYLDDFHWTLAAICHLPYRLRKMHILAYDPEPEFSPLDLYQNEFPSYLECLEIDRGVIDNIENFFESMPYLSTLVMTGVTIVFEELLHLPKSLRKLHLFNSLEFGNSEILEIKSHDALQELTIESSSSQTRFITEETCIDFSSLKNLTVLRFQCGALRSPKWIKLPLGLEKLTIGDCTNLADLAELAKLHSLKSLKFIGPFKLGMTISFFTTVIFPDSLEELVFCKKGSPMVDETLDDLVGSCPEKFIDVERRKYFKVGETFSLPPKLRNLEISFQYGIVPHGNLQLPSSLQYLSLVNGNHGVLDFPENLIGLNLSTMNTEKLRNVQFPKALQSLTLRSNCMYSISQTNLSSLSKVTRVDLSQNYLLRSESFVHQLPQTLEWLNLSYNRLRDCHLDNFPNLHTLALQGNRDIDILESYSITLPDNLVRLTLDSISIISDGFKFPSNLQQLSLTFSKCVDDEFFKDLPVSISRISLESCRLRVDSNIDLNLPNLKYCSFKSCNLNSSMTEAFSFLKCRKLEELVLARNYIQTINLETLPSSLEVLQLDNSKLSSIHGSFEKFPSLKILNLKSNMLGPWICQKGLAFPKTLLSIDLSNNSLTDISKIRWNDAISVLGLVDNDVDRESLAELTAKFSTRGFYPEIIIDHSIFDSDPHFFRSQNVRVEPA
ncbi:uncharacterized protein RJT20DRAFT_125286 [Scheffersomyces xylosifermentans]|uniref:uncharacterized protein n=1 Tax=Scheffersomyces xylosifermentans TaxID=1304137 RepID=UPI00315C9C85